MLKAVSWFVRPYTGHPEDYNSILDINCKRLRHYASTVEKVLGPELLKCNLHYVVCRLRPQCLARGHIGNESEIQIERAVQALKSTLGSHSVP